MNRLLLLSVPTFFSVRCGLFGNREIPVFKTDRCIQSSHLFYTVAYINSKPLYDIRPIIFVDKPDYRLGDLEF